MLLNNLDESLLVILWPLVFYIPVLISTFIKKKNFSTYLCITILQFIIPLLLLIPSPSGNGTDMIGYGAVVVVILVSQIFFIVLTLLILLGSFLYRRYKKKVE